MGIANIKKKFGFTLSRLGRLDSWKRVPLRLMVRYVAPERPRRFPMKIQIEATSRCNLRCPSCSHARDKDTGQHLTEDDFCRVLNRLPWSPSRLILSGIGEPLLNPQFFRLVDIMAERSIKCEFHTNGTLLTARMRQAIMSRSNIDTVNISCDGAQKETFESLRVGADFDRWKQSVRDFLTEAKQQREQTPSIGANVVLSKGNLSEIKDIIRLAAELGFGSVYVLDPIPVDDTAADLCPSPTELSKIRPEDLFELAKEFGLRVHCFFRRAKLPPKAIPRCMQPWEYMFIRANGDVAPCCAIFGSDKGMIMGNILEKDFEEIWRGRHFREFRRTSATGTNALCRICPYY